MPITVSARCGRVAMLCETRLQGPRRPDHPVCRVVASRRALARLKSSVTRGQAGMHNVVRVCV